MLHLTYYGHSAFKLYDDNHTIVIDPFLTGNPNAKVKPEEVKADFVILTHGHGDHLGDGIKIAKASDATVIAVSELADYCIAKGAKAHNMHIGGSFQFPFGRVKFTIAHHGSKTPDGEYVGSPAGVIVSIGGKNVYHCGDTGLFLDMKLIGDLTPIDIMLVPIGDNFTMGIDDAVMAVEFVNPKVAIPMHYNTWPPISADPSVFGKKLSEKGKNNIIMDFNETIEL
jgi:L-ascorbate metabolism protein UlaG (beta-lactamase superfamily)